MTVVELESLSPVTFLPDNLPAVSPRIATHVLHRLLAGGAVPVVLHLALDALHGHHLGLTALTGGLGQTGETGQEEEREESCLIIIIIEVFCLSDYISPGTTLLNALFFTALKGSLN